jgi:putative ABC transport system permease protein
MTSFELATKSLIRRPLSSVLAILSIALAVGCCGVLLRIYLLMNQRFSTLARGGDAIVGAKAGGIEILLNALNGEGPYPDFLPYKLFESLKAQQGVRFEDGAQSEPDYLRQTIPVLYFARFHDDRVMGTDNSFFNRPAGEASLTLRDGHLAEANKDIVLGSAVADKYNLKMNDDIILRLWVGDRAEPNGDGTHGPDLKFKITGVLNPTHTMWDRELYTTVAGAQEVVAAAPGLQTRSIWGASVLNYFLVYLKPNGFQPLKDLINKRTIGQSIFVLDEKKNLEELTGTGQTIGFFVSALVILLGGLSVASMLVTRFDAMGVQLAVLRAIGYKKSAIAAALLWEGFLLGLVACLVGIAIDLAAFPLMRYLLGGSLPPSDVIDSSIIYSSPVWVAALIATISSVLFPLLKLYRQDVHRSLQ